MKNRLASVLREVRRGETVQVTDRNRPVALLVPFRPGEPDAILRGLVVAGRVSWSGGKPRGSRRPARVRGPSVSDAVIEDRR